MVTLINNQGYKWSHFKSVYFKGYFILSDDKSQHIYRGKEACERINNITDFEAFLALLKSMEGSYAIIVNKNDKVWIAVDLARSMPLYYSTDGRFVSDSAENIRHSLGIAKEDVNKDSLVELYATYYLFGEKTVYDNIEQLDLCEAAEIKEGCINKKRYFYHYNTIENADVHCLCEKIEMAAYNAFKRLKSVIGDRPVVLSMSGGYDSRFVGCMLKNVGIEDVSCYTYGKLSSHEVNQSKKNAEALGYRWRCVEITDDTVSRALNRIGLDYLDSYNGHDFTAYMQNFVAVNELHSVGWFKPGSVFLTGLCGDMPTGCYVTQFDENRQYNPETATQEIYKMVFSRFTTPKMLTNKWMDWMRQKIEELPITINDYVSWQQAVDCIYTGTCHVHWYMHMNTVHSFFGYEWLLPYWDKELLMAWYSVPAALKYKQKIYEEWLLEVICKPYGLSQKKIVIGHSRKPFLRKIQYMGGGVLNYIYLRILNKPFKRKGDIYNFAPFCYEFYKRIKTKNCVNYRRSGMMQLLSQYLVEKRYGTDNLEYVCKNTFSRE